MSRLSDQFPSDVTGLPAAQPLRSLELADGDRVDLTIAPVAKRIGDVVVRMLAYNGSIPGPTLRVRQGSKLRVDVVNQGDVEATCIGTACASTTATMGLRKRNVQWRSAAASPTSSISRTRCLLVSPAHPRRLRPGDGAVREHRRGSVRSRLLAARPSGGDAHAG